MFIFPPCQVIASDSGYSSDSTGVVTVDGTGSIWAIVSGLDVGCIGNGTLDITSGGLVSVGGILTIDIYLDGDSVINMATGGMLALRGDADDLLGDFLGMIEGTDAIRYWDGLDWADITGANPGSDYTLSYLETGDLTGYTVLTVTTPVPEPSSFALLAGLSLAGLFARRRRKR